jgi:peptidoglycan hydrolase-like protein with peptidoglycan-binding domain
MKHALSAVVALAMGVGIIAAAEARGLNQQSGPPATNMQGAQMGQTQQNRSARPEANEQMVRQAQQQLKSQGLYQGHIDGLFGPQTRQALNQYQQRNGLPQTATLDQTTLNQLMGGEAGQAVGVGTSTPPNLNEPATPAPNPSAGKGITGYR